ncbi:MAG: 50S ribosomal protein L10 [Candidatus Krumholzibacteriia bacterium]
MARPEKVAEVEAIADKLRGAQSLVLADYTGLSVAQMTDFRSRCRAQNVDCRVVKNRLARIAAERVEMTALLDHLTGPTALVIGPASQVDPAKIVIDFAKDNEKLAVKGGIVAGQYIDPDQVAALSKVPSKDELIARMMGSINSPLSGVVYVVNGVMTSLARALDAVARQKAEAAS